jgi:mRNA interferase RelE/StbE
LPDEDRARVLNGLNRLAETSTGDIKKLAGSDSEWRLRIGHWRVRFIFDRARQAIIILRVLHRREAYRE